MELWIRRSWNGNGQNTHTHKKIYFYNFQTNVSIFVWSEDVRSHFTLSGASLPTSMSSSSDPRRIQLSWEWPNLTGRWLSNFRLGWAQNLLPNTDRLSLWNYIGHQDGLVSCLSQTLRTCIPTGIMGLLSAHYAAENSQVQASPSPMKEAMLRIRMDHCLDPQGKHHRDIK